MPDPFGSMQNFMGQFQNFARNPLQFMASRKLNLPQNWMQNPQGAIQQLMNNGQMSQSQYNQLQQMASQIMNQPQWQQMMGGQNGQQNGQGNSSSTR